MTEALAATPREGRGSVGEGAPSSVEVMVRNDHTTGRSGWWIPAMTAAGSLSTVTAWLRHSTPNTRPRAPSLRAAPLPALYQAATGGQPPPCLLRADHTGRDPDKTEGGSKVTQVTEAPDTIRNGVDTAQLFGTLDAVKAQPELAKFQFRVRNRWMGGSHNRSRDPGLLRSRRRGHLARGAVRRSTPASRPS